MSLLSNHLRTMRLAKAVPFVHGDVLDLGCGHALVRALGEGRIQCYVGVEQDERLVERLRQRYPRDTFFCRDLDSDEFDFGRKFDTVLMIALIEHVFNQKHLFQQALRCLKPKGKIVVTTPTPIGNDFVHRAGAALGLFAKSAVDDHIVIYNKKRFQILARELGLALQAYRRFELGCNQLAVLVRP